MREINLRFPLNDRTLTSTEQYTDISTVHTRIVGQYLLFVVVIPIIENTDYHQILTLLQTLTSLFVNFTIHRSSMSYN